MRAVNLLPSDLRGAPKAPPRTARPEPAAGSARTWSSAPSPSASLALAGYVLTSNTVKERQAELAQHRDGRRPPRRPRRAALKPYADFEPLAKARVATVRGLAARALRLGAGAARPLARAARPT